MTVVQLQFRHGTSAQWAAANPVLAVGEAGFDSSAGNFKIGNGTAVWNSLSFQSYNPATLTTILTNVQLSAASAETSAANAAASAAAGGAISSVAGRTGAIVLVATDVSNSTVIGRQLLTAADAAAARAILGTSTGGGGSLTYNYPTQAAAQAGLAANEFPDGAVVIVGP